MFDKSDKYCFALVYDCSLIVSSI